MFWLPFISLALGGTPQPIAVQDIAVPVQVDGRLDEEIYNSPPLSVQLLEFVPKEGGPPPGKTELWLYQDEKTLYLGARVSEIDYKVRAHISPRERLNFDDQIGIYLSTFGDPREGYLFYFNPLGVQQDIRMGPDSFSFAWDTQMKSKGRLTDDGFELEVAIPYRSIKYPSAEGAQQWKVFLLRKVPATGATYSYPQIQRRHPRLFSLGSDLTDVRPPSQGSGLEVIPSFTAHQTGQRTDLDQPLNYTGLNPWSDALRPALDVRFGFTPNLGLTATLNPDFSQIEADKTYVDLNQRFAFFLPERRPFFLDGSEYFADFSESLYTRSIVDPAYGLKLSGRAGKWGVGGLHLVDKSPTSTVHERETPGFGPDEVEEKVAVNHMVRVRRDVLNGGSVGLTAIDKRIFDPVAFQTHGQHTAVGADISIPLPMEMTLQSSTLQSWTGRSGEPLLWGQENQVRLARYARIGTNFELLVADRSLGLRKEMGFLNQSGLTLVNGELAHAIQGEGALDLYRPKVEFMGQFERNGEGFQTVQFDQRITHHGIHSWKTELGLSHTKELDTELWGWWAGVEYEADWASWIGVETESAVGRILDFDRLQPATVFSTVAELTVRPTASLSWQNSLFYERLFPQSDDAEVATRWRSRVNWQFTRELGLRVISEHTSGTDRDPRLISSVLLSWLLHPGTAAYLGYSETTQLKNGVGALDRAVFGKVSVYIRP